VKEKFLTFTQSTVGNLEQKKKEEVSVVILELKVTVTIENIVGLKGMFEIKLNL
jgi:hypothetical protein